MASMKSKKSNKHVKFGDHLIYDAYGCSFDKLNDEQLCIDVMNKIAKLAKMKKLMEPLTISATSNETLGGKDPGGFSGFVMIQESHISIHTFAKRGFVTIDVYSCKVFEAEKVIEYLNSIFDPKDTDILKMERALKYPDQNIH